MKNPNDAHIRKARNHVIHLQSFIGMPMWNWNGRNPTLSEIRDFDRLVLAQQKKQAVWA